MGFRMIFKLFVYFFMSITSKFVETFGSPKPKLLVSTVALAVIVNGGIYLSRYNQGDGHLIDSIGSGNGTKIEIYQEPRIWRDTFRADVYKSGEYQGYDRQNNLDSFMNSIRDRKVPVDSMPDFLRGKEYHNFSDKDKKLWDV